MEPQPLELPSDPYLNPGHVVLLHLLHLVLHHGVQLVLKLQRLQVVHVPGPKDSPSKERKEIQVPRGKNEWKTKKNRYLRYRYHFAVFSVVDQSIVFMLILIRIRLSMSMPIQILPQISRMLENMNFLNFVLFTSFPVYNSRQRYTAGVEISGKVVQMSSTVS
jgi:hypothetical protein